MFQCEFCEVSKNTLFREHLRWLLLIFDKTLDMAYELNGRKNICIFGNVITLQIIIRYEISGNNNLFKVTDTLIFVLKQTLKYKKNSNTNVFSLHYEPLHIRNPDIFIIGGIFRTLEYSRV